MKEDTTKNTRHSRVLILWLNKGGTFKTLFVSIVGAILHMRRGFRVLVVDADAQANLTANHSIETDSIPTIYEVIKGKIAAKDAIVQLDCFDILPAPTNTALDDDDLIPNKPGREHRLKMALDSLRADYDFILVDVGTGFSTLTMNALTFGDELIFPIAPDKGSITAIEQSLANIDTVQAFTNPNLKVSGILLGKMPWMKVNGVEMRVQEISELVAAYEIPLFQTRIRYSFTIDDTKNKDKRTEENPLIALPNSDVVKDFVAFVDNDLMKGYDTNG